MNRIIIFISLTLMLFLAAMLQIESVVLFGWTPLFVLATLIAYAFSTTVFMYVPLVFLGTFFLDWQLGLSTDTLIIFGLACIALILSRIIRSYPWVAVVLIAFCETLVFYLLQGVPYSMALVLSTLLLTALYAFLMLIMVKGGRHMYSSS